MTDRRNLLGGAILAGLALGVGTAVAATPFAPALGPRARMIFVNDLAGDFDGLMAAAHALLSPSLDLRAIVGTAEADPAENAQRAAELAKALLAAADRSIEVVEGAGARMTDPAVPVPSPGSLRIIEEAMRTDTRLPLYVAVGGGLTEVASAVLIDHRIAERLILVWIGGTASQAAHENNFALDPLAARYLFNETNVPIWQIPCEAYANCQVSMTELEANVGLRGRLGRWLYQQALAGPRRIERYRINTGETWALGDSPLVLVTALADWVPGRMSATRYELRPTPHLDVDGLPEKQESGRPMRLYTALDVRLMLADFYAKLRLASA